MAGYVVYDDLKQMVLESGRPYDMEMLDKAYQLAARAHDGQFRRSGEPYICHPLHVAMLLVDLGMDTESLAAALMHDVVEDTSVTLDELESQFGADVAHMVDGVTKLTKIKFSSVEEQQAENLRKMLMAMSQDVRVMIIKLCDRLHNMRTGDAWPEQKRRDKALETMEVYAPIAHRLGISNIKEELEDRSLRYLDPVGYQNIKDLLAENGGREFVTNIAEVIRERLAENGMPEAIMKSRVKSVYGIYRKMFMQNRDFEEIYDVYAVRCPTGSRTISPPPSPTATSLCTPPSSAMRAFPSRCRFALARWIRWRNTAWRLTGNTRPASRAVAATVWRSAWPGYASCWKVSGRTRTRAACCRTSRATFCLKRCLPLRPRAM